VIFEVEVNGRLRAVAIEPAREGEGRFRITVDGRTREFDVSSAGDTRLLLFEGAAGDHPADGEPAPAQSVREVYVAPGSAGEVLVTLDGWLVRATVNGRRTGHAAEAGVHAHGEVGVTAPMPGRVVRVLVSPGDQVAARQGVVVVEAMKMENELRAPKAGRVKEVFATPGTSVDAGKVLVVIE
jgi:biotin carboxyl carrier protein